MRYAAVDVGTNSCRLLVADIEDNKLLPVHKQIVTTRVGEGVDKTGRINAEAMERTIMCLKEFCRQIEDWQAAKYHAIATSAVRGAENGREFIEAARTLSHMEIEIVSGETEAVLSYRGVKQGLCPDSSPLVVDLGGGSTEFICADEGFILSLPLGAVRATESQLTVVQINDLLHPIRESRNIFSRRELVFVGGTATSLVAIKKGLDVYDPNQVHGERLTRSEIGDLYDLLERTPLTLRRRLPGLQPERADIIPQ